MSPIYGALSVVFLCSANGMLCGDFFEENYGYIFYNNEGCDSLTDQCKRGKPSTVDRCYCGSGQTLMPERRCAGSCCDAQDDRARCCVLTEPSLDFPTPPPTKFEEEAKDEATIIWTVLSVVAIGVLLLSIGLAKYKAANDGHQEQAAADGDGGDAVAQSPAPIVVSAVVVADVVGMAADEEVGKGVTAVVVEGKDHVQEIEQLENLLARGILTQEEFEKGKERVLASYKDAV